MAGNATKLIVGIGGMGGNTLNGIASQEDLAAILLGIDTDEGAILCALAPHTLLIGQRLLHGNGAGGSPKLGQEAAESSWHDISPYIAEAGSVYLIAGLGGGTGSGAIPVIARNAMALGKPVTCIVSMPFNFEGEERCIRANKALSTLEALGVTPRVFKNQDLFTAADEKTTFAEAFRMADATILEWIAQ